MTGLILTALGILGGLGMAALGDMVSEEVRDRLDHLPHAILRLAARRLDPAQRVTLYKEVWLPDLAYFLKGDEARPVTRLIHGTRYAVGILASARCIVRNLPRPDQGGYASVGQHLVRMPDGSLIYVKSYMRRNPDGSLTYKLPAWPRVIDHY